MRKDITNQSKLCNSLQSLYHNKLLTAFKKIKFNIQFCVLNKSKNIFRLCSIIKASHNKDYQNAFVKLKLFNIKPKS